MYWTGPLQAKEWIPGRVASYPAMSGAGTQGEGGGGSLSGQVKPKDLELHIGSFYQRHTMP